MYLRVPLYKYKLYSTYGYLRTSISTVTPTGDLSKYKSAISTSMCISLLYEFKFSISTSMRIRLLYEYMKNSDICYCISVTVICLL